MKLNFRVGILAVVALFAPMHVLQAQQPPAGGPPFAGPGGPGGPGGGGGFTPTETALYVSKLVKLGGNAADGLLYEPKNSADHPRVAAVTTFAPSAAELANRGYRALVVRHINKPGEAPTPFRPFDEISRGIAYARTLPGVQRVVVMAWGEGAMSMLLYADVAQNGPSACNGKQILYPCTTEQASGLSKPDGVILFDPSLGGAYKILNIDPAYDGSTRDRADLDLYSAASGFDIATGSAKYSADFRKRYLAAQSARNDQAIDQAIARLKVLEQTSSTADEPLVIPGAVNAADSGSLHHNDLTLLSHTKGPHTLLKADGTRPEVIIQSIRTSTGPVGEDAVKRAEAQNDHPRDSLTVRQFLSSDAVRTTMDFNVTEDDISGIEWKTSNTASPGQAEGVTMPALIEVNTCFQFVVPSEVTFNHLASKDKTFIGLEGADHGLGPCKPEYGDTRKRLFDYIDGWLTKPGRF